RVGRCLAVLVSRNPRPSHSTVRLQALSRVLDEVLTNALRRLVAARLDHRSLLAIGKALEALEQVIRLGGLLDPLIEALDVLEDRLDLGSLFVGQLTAHRLRTVENGARLGLQVGALVTEIRHS